MNIKKTESMTLGPPNFNVDNADFEIVKDFVYLGSVINLNGDCSQEIKRRLTLGRATMKELGKIIKCKEASLETTAKVTHTLVFPITVHRCKSWTVKKADKKNIDSFEMWCWRRALQIPWVFRKMNMWVLEQIKPELLLEAKKIKQAFLLWAHYEKAGFFGKDNNAGKSRRQQEKRKTKYEMD